VATFSSAAIITPFVFERLKNTKPGVPHFSRFREVGRTPPTPRASLFITTDPCATSPNAKLNVAILFPCGASPKRYYGAGDLHFITCSCYRRQPLLGKPRRRSLFLTALEQVHRRYQFVVIGYVVMTGHIHLLLNGE
jgi:hypothetical protein